MHPTQFLGFATVSLALALAPGPSWIYVLSTTFSGARRAGLIAVLGNATGIVCHVVAVAAGLSAVLTYSTAVYSTVRWLGALYLVYLGVQTLRQGVDLPAGPREDTPRSPLRIYSHGVLVNLLNPKVALVMLALLPQFADPAAGRVPLQILAIGMTHALIASLVLIALTLLAGGLSRRLRAAPRAARGFRLAAGSTLIAAGLRLAIR